MSVGTLGLNCRCPFVVFVNRTARYQGSLLSVRLAWNSYEDLKYAAIS